MHARNVQRKVARAATAAATLLGSFGLVAPAAAQGVIGTGSGRTGATVALLVALIGVVTGGRAVSRSATRNARDGAIVALVLGLIGMALAGLHLATTTGGFYGTGNGRGGAIVAFVLGMIGTVLGWLAIDRSARTDRPADASRRVASRRETRTDV